MSGNEAKEGALPSLLMKAAKSAAEADGVAASAAAAAANDNNKPPAPLKPSAKISTSAGEAAAQTVAAATAKASSAPPTVPTRPAMNINVQRQPAPVRASSSSRAPASSSGGAGGKKKGPALRRGKWTPEEEAYANRLIQEFKAGLLPLTDGTTLRTFLSKLLNCDPMRISKKFVGSNCIGKQVFRRRTADINRLTPEQIQQSRAELSELERRFLERVAQTNRVKSSGGAGGVGSGSGSGGGGSVSAGSAAMPSAAMSNSTSAAVGGKDGDGAGGLDGSPPSPPWLHPPAGFKSGNAGNGSGTNRAAAAGRALLQGNPGKGKSSANDSTNLLMAALQQRQSQQHLLQAAALQAAAQGNMAHRTPSASNLLAAATAAGSTTGGISLAQIARNASAKIGSGTSIDNIMLKTGLSRDQLNQLARDQSLSNLMEKQNSFDALMSLDFQSLQSIDNLANLIQTGGGSQASQVPKSGMKNWDGGSTSSANLAAAAVAAAAKAAAGGSGTNLANLSKSKQASSSEARMESILRSLSSGNVVQKGNNACGSSNANFSTLLQSLQSQNSLGAVGGSANNLFGSGNPSASSAINLASMLRTDSSTGLTALRMQDGLAQRNTSVDDFLSLVASGDIPHQDPHLLNVPLQSVMQQQQQQGAVGNQAGAQQAAATYLAQQQLLAQAASGGGGNSISSSLGNLAGNASVQNLLSQLAASQGASSANLTAAGLMGNDGGNKRKFEDKGDSQGPSKRS